MEMVSSCPISFVNDLLEVLRVLWLLDADVFLLLFSEILWVFWFSALSERSYWENCWEKGLFGSHGYWQWEVIVVKNIIIPLSLSHSVFFYLFLKLIA